MTSATRKQIYHGCQNDNQPEFFVFFRFFLAINQEPGKPSNIFLGSIIFGNNVGIFGMKQRIEGYEREERRGEERRGEVVVPTVRNF